MSTPATDPPVEPGTSEPSTVEPGTPEPGTPEPGTAEPGTAEPGTAEPSTAEPGADELRDLAEVPAAEVIAASCVHLMSAAAVKCGLTELGEQTLDLDEARKLITALAGLVMAARPDLGIHANALRDGLQALQAAFREASTEPDAPGEGPGERLTGSARR